jgi:signal transduction histidine kinase
VTLDVTGDESDCDLPTRTALFRAAQEALTNVRRHARARHVSVRLAFEGSGAELVVADDGRGLSTQREGFGLVGMRERIQLVGGRVDLRSGPATGTCLTVTVPAERAGTIPKDGAGIVPAERAGIVPGGRGAVSTEVPHGG